MFRAALAEFAEALTKSFASLTPAQAEDQLKGPLQNLLTRVGAAQGRNIVPRTEAHVREVGGRPDLAIDIDGLLSGHIELKAPGVGADPRRFKKNSHNQRQWNKFKVLPNLIYTDGNDWTLLRAGKRIAGVKFSGDVSTDGSDTFTDDEAAQLENLLRVFFGWNPIVPTSPQGLAQLLAPLTRLVRNEVQEALTDPNSYMSHLAQDWRAILFPDSDDAKFADAYAQTLTYALLLAKFGNESEAVTLAGATATLDSGYSLLADALRLLSDRRVADEVGVGLDILLRAIDAVDPEKLKLESDDPWLYFYEDFLAAYDPRLRNNYGVYYTPLPVIQTQVRLVADLLAQRFEKSLNYADDDVVVLDPAAGTGAYPLSIFQHALGTVSTRYGPGVRASYATTLAENVHGFEILVGPYAVAHLRLTQMILEEGGKVPEDGVQIYLTDTLESPDKRDLERTGLVYRNLAEEHERARKVKSATPVMVCIGNPPYDRQLRDQDDIQAGAGLRGSWVRFGEINVDDETRGILRDFIEPARKKGHGQHLKSIYNEYVYFWRWALWKVFEQADQRGIVSFITAASYIRGPGFVGMREHMRRLLDELWIIDLEGDGHGARRTENVFAIRTPVAIAIGIRHGEPQPETPAHVHYTRITGSRADKLEQLAKLDNLGDLEWQRCYSGWQEPFLPVGVGDYHSWPRLTDLFPWQQSGVMTGRNWPIGVTQAALHQRWHVLRQSNVEGRRALFKDSPTGRKAHAPPPNNSIPRSSAQSVMDLDATAATPAIMPYAFRSFDRQWLFADARVIDRPSPKLWTAYSTKQLFMTTLLTKVLGEGPAATVCAFLPDRDHFSNRGGKDIIPLWRDAEASVPNVTSGLLSILSKTFHRSITPEALFAYAYAILASPDYVNSFSEELTVPGPRLPLTKNAALFDKLVEMGKTLVGWHTYGERWTQKIQSGRARNTKAVPLSGQDYPATFSYNADKETLHVGDGKFAPVSESVWTFSVSGLQVVRSWLGYRMATPAGRTSSKLDQIQPQSWTQDMTIELLELLWTLEATIDLYPALNERLAEVLLGPVFSADELPLPTESEKAGPTSTNQLSLF